ncbi:multidrug efflux SMR transporter [Brevibacillus laterosporus]|nr:MULTISPECIES: multidrug efflux SMR transporter [Brevibacillus]MBA4535233.1 multidrug efflux SMR transporter [Brevibacillus halotolerans]MCR8964343.1 multidrug efflux SMR transporter [Brevibacillus laterosporus]MCR8995856.1 multidrug efflux SMR transporter [Brevibacillus laterosporus]MCZ0836498.1 multidrug efflux SMR transporter [Brevibacillus halotolerans]MDF9413052.1 multidrug efflux SMR transporter [Brevibacillus laterosporus]
MSWVFLGVAILLEVAGTTMMKLSNGLTKIWPTILMFVFYLICFSSLSLALKKLEVGVVYAIWSGIGTALIATIGIIWFKDSLSLQKVIAILLIIAGCVLLNLQGGSHGAPAEGKHSEETEVVASDSKSGLYQ